MKKLSVKEQIARYEEFTKISDEPPTLMTAFDDNTGINVEKKLADDDELSVEYEICFTRSFTTLTEFEFNSLIEFLQDIRDKKHSKHLDI